MHPADDSSTLPRQRGLKRSDEIIALTRTPDKIGNRRTELVA
jgi:hypothetical protein